MAECLACGRAAGREFTAHEMMFGTREPFGYRECAGCGSLQIVRVPDDLARHYGAGYYAHAVPKSRLMHYVRGRRAAHVLGKRSWLGRVLAWRYGVPADLRATAAAAPGLATSVLDVGCGSGALLRDLHAAGLARVAGVDPFAPQTTRHTGGVTVWKHTLAEHDGGYDLILMHHSLEHMAHPLAALREARRLLSPGGQLLVRVPIAGSHAWRTYGTHWVQLDAPRHLFVPSAGGFRALARAAGLELVRVAYDSDAFQFWGSELYRRDLSLTDARGRRRDSSAAGYSAAEAAELVERARRLNIEGDGDQACFYLRSAPTVEGAPRDRLKS